MLERQNRGEVQGRNRSEVEAMEIGLQASLLRKRKNRLAAMRPILPVTAAPLLIVLVSGLAFAGHAYHGNSASSTGEPPPKGDLQPNHHGHPAAVPSPLSANSASNPANPIHGTTTTKTTAINAPSSNVLPPVPLTAFIQVPPVPGDPFQPAPPPAMTSSPPAAPAAPPRPMAIGLGSNSTPLYQVSCAVAEGNYCVFTSSYPVATGSKCHCGQTAGSTE